MENDVYTFTYGDVLTIWPLIKNLVAEEAPHLVNAYRDANPFFVEGSTLTIVFSNENALRQASVAYEKHRMHAVLAMLLGLIPSDIIVEFTSVSLSNRLNSASVIFPTYNP